MKKLFLSAILLASLSFVSCSKDDDGGNSNLTCEEATAALEAVDDSDPCDSINRLKDVKAACGDEDGTIQTSIDALEAICSLIPGF